MANLFKIHEKLYHNNPESKEFVTEDAKWRIKSNFLLFSVGLRNKEVKTAVKKLQTGYSNVDPIFLTEWAFAIVIICASGDEELQMINEETLKRISKNHKQWWLEETT